MLELDGAGQASKDNINYLTWRQIFVQTMLSIQTKSLISVSNPRQLPKANTYIPRSKGEKETYTRYDELLRIPGYNVYNCCRLPNNSRMTRSTSGGLLVSNPRHSPGRITFHVKPGTVLSSIMICLLYGAVLPVEYSKIWPQIALNRMAYGMEEP